MGAKKKKERRNQLGYGSSYRMGKGRDLTGKNEIGSVLGGQVWMVKPGLRVKFFKKCYNAKM